MLKQDHNDKKGQFRLVKFFAYASFIVLVIFSFPFSMVISQKAKVILMKSYENYALLLGDNLNYQVFEGFVLPLKLRFREEISLRKEWQYKWVDKIVKSTTHSFKIDVVNIYDIGKGVIAYSTNPELMGRRVSRTLGYDKAVNGEQSSGLLSEGSSYWGFGIEKIGVEKKLRTYIPFRGIAPIAEGQVLGVFELIQDLTDEYQSLIKLQYLIFGLSILIMGLIFVALLFIVHKAEGIISQRAMEQSELEAQLNQAERLATLGQMIAGVSHEIRNPLGIIRSTAELLGSMSGEDDTKQTLSNVIVEESSRLNNIVTEFLDFARPQEPNVQDCYLEELIRKNIDFLKPELKKQNISIRDNINERSFLVKADPQLLYRAFLNIFVNAIDSMEHGGSINVDISEKDSFYMVQISDTGCGISEEHLSKIFNPFFSTKVSGSGLGLPIVRNIIEGHKGNIRIRSETGFGTKIIVTLPENHSW